MLNTETRLDTYKIMIHKIISLLVLDNILVLLKFDVKMSPFWIVLAILRSRFQWLQDRDKITQKVQYTHLFVKRVVWNKVQSFKLSNWDQHMPISVLHYSRLFVWHEYRPQTDVAQEKPFWIVDNNLPGT